MADLAAIMRHDRNHAPKVTLYFPPWAPPPPPYSRPVSSHRVGNLDVCDLVSSSSW